MLVACRLADGTSSSSNRPPRPQPPSAAASGARKHPDPTVRHSIVQRRSRPSRHRLEREPLLEAGIGEAHTQGGVPHRLVAARKGCSGLAHDERARSSTRRPGHEQISGARDDRGTGEGDCAQPGGAEPLPSPPRNRFGQTASSAAMRRRSDCPRGLVGAAEEEHPIRPVDSARSTAARRRCPRYRPGARPRALLRSGDRVRTAEMTTALVIRSSRRAREGKAPSLHPCEELDHRCPSFRSRASAR